MERSREVTSLYMVASSGLGNTGRFRGWSLGWVGYNIIKSSKAPFAPEELVMVTCRSVGIAIDLQCHW